eukprot:5673331-Amphidinium_carterae.1
MESFIINLVWSFFRDAAKMSCVLLKQAVSSNPTSSKDSDLFGLRVQLFETCHVKRMLEELMVTET